jgi:hypothetical protein
LAEFIVTARIPRALGGTDLVAHQGKQRGNDDRWPGALSPAQRGGDEIDR